jgi:hypothetical protein
MARSVGATLHSALSAGTEQVDQCNVMATVFRANLTRNRYGSKAMICIAIVQNLHEQQSFVGYPLDKAGS